MKSLEKDKWYEITWKEIWKSAGEWFVIQKVAEGHSAVCLCICKDCSSKTISDPHESPRPTFQTCEISLEQEAEEKHGQDSVNDGQVGGGEHWRN